MKMIEAMKRRVALRPLVAAGALVVLGACASAGGAEPGQAEQKQRAPVVLVENDNWAQVDVYAERAGLAIRLGTVPSAGRASFALPATMQHTSDVRLVVEPLASRAGYVSPMLTWGESVRLRVSNHLPLSTVVPVRSD